MTKRRLFLELLENKKKVKNDKLYEFHSSPEESVVQQSFTEHVEPVVALEESLLKDLLQSEDLNSNNLNHQNESVKQPVEVNASDSISRDVNPKENVILRNVNLKETVPVNLKENAAPVNLRGDLKNVARTKPALSKPKYESGSELPKALNDEAKKAEITIKKQELLIKFDILRKNSSRHIPLYTLNHNYSVMKHHYKLLVKQLHIDNKITFYKQCLLGFSGYLEIFLGEAFMGLDMKGYTEFQANNMNHYDKILLKIGEKSYLPQTMSSMPVEVQLLIAIGIQTAMFIGSKMISSKTGLNIASLFKQNSDVNLDMPKS